MDIFLTGLDGFPESVLLGLCYRLHDAPHYGLQLAVIHVEGQSARLDHLVVGHVCEIEVEAVVSGKVVDKHPLRPAVPLPERVKHVHLTQVVRQALMKLVSANIAQVVLGFQFAEQVACVVYEVCALAELVALGYVHRSQLASPVVHVAEDGLVDAHQVLQVKRTLDRFVGYLQHCDCGDAPLRLMQPRGIMDAELVDEDVGFGIAVPGVCLILIVIPIHPRPAAGGIR